MAQIDKLESLLHRLEAAVTRIENAKVGGSGSSAGSTSAEQQESEKVLALEQWYKENYAPWVQMTRKLGKELPAAADIAEKGYQELRRIVSVASRAKKPADSELPAFFQALGKIITSGDDYARKTRGDYYDHLLAITEGLKTFSWVGVQTAVSHVKESIPSVQFYSNKVLVKYRKTDQAHVDWVNGFKKWQEELGAYVKEHHMTGLSWNPQGKSLKEAESASQQSAPAAVPSSGAPPPPPPAPKNEDLFKDSFKNNDEKVSMADVFAQINSGNVTAGLKKVSDDQKSKNRKDRSGLVSAESLPKKTVTVKGAKARGPPRFELVDKKWVIENQENNENIVIDKPDMKQTVYVSNCKNSIIRIQGGKINAITLDNCQKTGILFENAVSSVEIVNCSSVQVQVTGRVPTIVVDKTDGAQMILSNESLDTVIVSSKSSEMNINVPKDDDFEEIPIPEQYETIYNPKTKKFETRPTSHASA